MSGRRLAQYLGIMSPAQVANGMTCAARNARRLVDDARRLLELGRLPTAAALAILSIEESGKTPILRRLSTVSDPKVAREVWREYRSHTKKNVMYPFLHLIGEGARHLDDFAPLFDDDAEHPRLLDNIKQISLYTDCLGDGHWSEPQDVVDKGLAEDLVQTADVLCKDREYSEEEIRLWIKHLKPVEGKPHKWHKRAVLNWHEEAVDKGLFEDTSLDTETFFFGDGENHGSGPSGESNG